MTLRGEPGFPQPVGLVYSRANLYLVTRVLPGLPLDSLLWLSSGKKEKITAELSARLRALEKNGLLHRDISPSNLLWNEDALSLVDFEFAHRRSEEIPVVSAYEAHFASTLIPGVGRHWRGSNIPVQDWDRSAARNVEDFIRRKKLIRDVLRIFLTRFATNAAQFSLRESLDQRIGLSWIRIKVVFRRTLPWI